MGHEFVKFFSSCFTDLLTILEVERALTQYLELDLYSFSYPPKLRARNRSMKGAIKYVMIHLIHLEMQCGKIDYSRKDSTFKILLFPGHLGF